MRALVFALMMLPFASFPQESDTTLSLHIGKFSGHARTFFMATINESDLTDYHAWAIGAGMGYESPEIKRFKVGISGFFVCNLMSSNLSIPDPITNIPNRYEIGLFDITHPNDKELHRLEELFIQYRIHRSFIRGGNLILNTPFINPQDGRMRPTLGQGFTLEINEIKNVKIEGAYISKISPRSTMKWYSVGESIGIYPQGLSASGVRSDYAGHVNSEGIYLLGLTYKKRTSISLWDTFVDNISNTAFVQIEWEFPKKYFYAGLKYIRQDAVGDGGNADGTHAYMIADTYSNVVSSRVGHKKKNFDVNLNTTIIDGNGRYLMPREWGRDPFYTFIPRERNEGAGSVKAFSLNMTCALPKIRLRPSMGIGYYNMPDINNYVLNKYGMPSFMQFNVEIPYTFSGYLEGATLQFLYTYKFGIGEDYGNPKTIINKVNMTNVNMVLNYKFENYYSLSKKAKN